MIDVHLYGSLRRHAPNPDPTGDSVIHLKPRPGETVRTALERLGISPSEVYHIFLNGALVSTNNSMADLLKYRRSQSHGLDVPLRPGDRLGLFAHDMAMLVV